MEAEFFYNAEHYHQKYLLRGHSMLLKSLPLTDGELITSHVASKLNGYLGGYGNEEQFEKEKEEFGLGVEQLQYIKRNLSRKSRFKCA